MEKIVRVKKGEEILLPDMRALLTEKQLAILREWVLEIVAVPSRSIAGDRITAYFARCHRGENGRWRETTPNKNIDAADSLGGSLIMERVQRASK